MKFRGTEEKYNPSYTISTNPLSFLEDIVPIDNDYDDVYLHKITKYGLQKTAINTTDVNQPNRNKERK
jgi:hypothetical protein